MRIGFIYPYPANRDNTQMRSHIYGLERPYDMEVFVFSMETETDKQIMNHDYYSTGENQIRWKAIREARVKGMREAMLVYNCDWIIHHDFEDMFQKDFLLKLDETIKSGKSHQYSALSYYAKHGQITITPPIYNMIDPAPITLNHPYWKRAFYNQLRYDEEEPDRYYYVRKGYVWIWDQTVCKFLAYDILPNSKTDQRHEGSWRDRLWNKGYKCILDTEMIVFDSSDKFAIEYFDQYRTPEELICYVCLSNVWTKRCKFCEKRTCEDCQLTVEMNEVFCSVACYEGVEELEV